MAQYKEQKTESLGMITKRSPMKPIYEAIGKFKKHTGVRTFYIGVEYHISP